MKKLLLLVGLVVFLIPMYANADQVKLSCKCFKHEFERVNKSYRQCPRTNEIWIIDYDNFTIRNKSYAIDDIFLDITENSQDLLVAHFNHFENRGGLSGIWEVTIKNNNDEQILTFLHDEFPNAKKKRYYKYSSSCKELQRIVTLDPFEAKQQLCEKLGFSIGSQENGNCVLKIFEIESNLKQKEKSAGGQLTEADKLIRQQRLNQSLMLMQQGLNLMSPPQPKLNCRNTITGWACY